MSSCDLAVRALQGSTAYVIYSINPESTQAGALQQPLSIECRAYTRAYYNAMLMNVAAAMLWSGAAKCNRNCLHEGTL